MVFGVKMFSHYLSSQRFEWQTDHSALLALQNMTEHTVGARMMRWVLFLQGYGGGESNDLPWSFLPVFRRRLAGEGEQLPVQISFQNGLQCKGLFVGHEPTGSGHE